MKKQLTNPSFILLIILVSVASSVATWQFAKDDGKTANDWHNAAQQAVYCHGYTLGEDVDSFSKCLQLDYRSEIAPALER